MRLGACRKMCLPHYETRGLSHNVLVAYETRGLSHNVLVAQCACHVMRLGACRDGMCLSDYES